MASNQVDVPSRATDDAADWLLIEQPVPAVLLLRLNRPERRNALSTPLLERVAAELASADEDQGIRVVVLAGNEKVFAAGADLDELARSDPSDPVETPRYRAWASIRTFRKPLLAAVEGWCLGAGAELMMCADIVIAGAGAKLGQPETNLGIIPGAGGTATLTRLVGRAQAMKMVLTGEPIDADAALAAGLIAEATPEGGAETRTLALAGMLAARAPLALEAAKASIRAAGELFEPDHLRAERLRFIELLGSADKAEGIRAFKEKRMASWTGR